MIPVVLANVTDPALLASVPLAYDGPCRLLDWGHKARDGMTLNLLLGVTGPSGAHPFRGYRSGKEDGQRLKVLVHLPAEDPTRAVVVFAGECILLQWWESGANGMSVKFLLDDGPDGHTGRHPFYGLATGKKTGEHLVLKAWLLADDETVVPPSTVKRTTPFNQKTPVEQAHILSRNPRFQRFLADNLDRLVPDAPIRASLEALRDSGKDFADAVVRAALGVPTRAVMNTDGHEAEKARGRWLGLMAMYDDTFFGRRSWSREDARSASGDVHGQGDVNRN